MIKSFKQRLAALERLEAQPWSPGEAIDALSPDELVSEALQAVWDGAIVFHGPGNAHPAAELVGILPEFADAYERAERAAALCDRLNAELAGAVFPLMGSTDAAAWLERFQAGDYAISASRSPDYAVMQYLRRPNGEIWNTQSGGELVVLGRVLWSTAAQLGQPLTLEGVVGWLLNLY